MCNCRVLQLIFLTITSILSSAESLSGDHICTRVENQTLTIRESYTEPVMVQTFAWCMQVPPRCPKTRIENRIRYRIKTTVKERKISECCEGYVIQENTLGEADADLNCIPYCKSCENGLCLKPNACQCEPGYQGNNCAHECPPGFWGRQCLQQCDCASAQSCDPVTGICECPAGWQGPGCKVPCFTGRWGLRCESICDCGGRYMACDPGTGKCYTEKIGDPETTTTSDWAKTNLDRVDEDSGVFEAGSSTSVTTERKEINRITEKIVTEFDDHFSTPEIEGFGVPRVSKTTEQIEDDILQTISEDPKDFDFVEPESPISTESTSTTSSNDLTQFQNTISQTLPKSGFTNTPRTSDELFYRKENNDFESETKTAGPPHPSFVKTVQKEQVPQIQHDTTILIVVGAVVSLSLTTLAALMVFYLKSKVFESVPLSIYGSDKNDDDNQDKNNTIRRLKITSTTLPPLPTFVNPVFAANPESALITFDAAELNKHYDNRTGTISIRVSGNIRDLLESHYDRPPAATCRHTKEQNTEHVYDEIPLTTPLCIQKAQL